MDSLSDPRSVRNRADVEFREEQSVDDGDGVEYFASIDGLVAVGITNEAGAVLLMDSPHGWRLPYGPVDVDEDWVTAGEHIGEELTGVDVEIAGVERVARITHREESDDGREATSYDVVMRTIPLSGKPISGSPSFGPWDELDLEWFSSVPDDAYWDHGDAVDDIRTVLE